MKKQTHLKSIGNGRVFLYSDTLATRDDMVACDASGKIAEGHTGDATAIDAKNERRITKFLGNVTNGVLYPYTEYLAQRDDMVSIDTEKQWETMRETGEAPEQVKNAIVPASSKKVEPTTPGLSRDPIESGKKVDPPASAQGSGEYSLPVIEGMGAREAKTTLSDWALKNFNVTIDRRPKLDKIIDECRILSMSAMDKASSQ